jgi:hypothetical protein
MNNAVCSATITLVQHHHQNYAAGTGHKSAFILIIITRQQDPALRLLNFTHHHITTLDLAQMGRIDIITEVSCLASCLALPWKGRLDAVFHVFALSEEEA